MGRSQRASKVRRVGGVGRGREFPHTSGGGRSSLRVSEAVTQGVRILLQGVTNYFCGMVPNTGLCVGLDVDPSRFPAEYTQGPDSIVEFCSEIISLTRDVATCYKINTAFYEQFGRKGIDALYAVRDAVGTAYVIADAKRGDIGNTSSAYARAVFEDLQADAITVAPYMGRDSVEPFLQWQGKMVYVLALTSNPGSADFQRQNVGGKMLFEHVMESVLSWDRVSDIGFVVGATHERELAAIRTSYTDVAFLVPGIGAQGGDARLIASANAGGPAVFNVSRGLIYAGSGEDWRNAVRTEAIRLAHELHSPGE
ncbi:MAG TPA: orotidine-5'-phosphate decarboxylase [Bacteroidetes bacterium]|nr:orotidine-5'-phosphate decarboxylase [Bacteroidota bacterium]